MGEIEIRDKVIGELASLTYQSCIDASHKPRRESDYLPLAHEILSIPELAIVDREAELPPSYPAKYPVIYVNAQEDMLKAGYVKEVKE